ncbi:MAG: GAF domain-containing protein, partial [Nitrospirota bacterium]
METRVLPAHLQELEQKVAYAEQVKLITNKIHAAQDLNQILLDLHKEILNLFDAEGLTLYAVDTEKKEIFARIPHIDTVEEIRMPIGEQSLAGFTAKYLRPINIGDAYNKSELSGIHPSLLHDSSWDKKTGIKTKQVLTYPIVAENKYLMGVIQLLNKKSGGRFTKKEEDSVAEIAKGLGIAFYNLRKLAKKTTKFDHLVANNLITQAELDSAIAEARKGPMDLESLLIEKYKVPRDELGKSLSQFYKCPHMEYNERLLLDPDLLRTLNVDYLKKNFWAPVKRDKSGVEILIDDPNDLDKVQDIKRSFPGQNLRFAVGLRRDISHLLRVATGQPDPTTKGSVSDILGELISESQAEQAEELSTGGVDENDSAIVRLANQV